MFDPFGQENFEQGLIGNIAFVCQYLKPIEHGLRQSDRNSFSRRFQIREREPFGFAPVHIVCGVVLGPKLAFLVFVMKRGNFLFLGHDRISSKNLPQKPLSRLRSYAEAWERDDNAG